MRIALLQDHLRNGGTENQTLFIAEGLAQAGLETSVIVFREGGVLDKEAARGSFQIHFLNQGPLKTDWFAPGLKKLLLKEDFDVAIGMGRMANCQIEVRVYFPHRQVDSIPPTQSPLEIGSPRGQ